MTESLEVSIVMPCLNEAETLPTCIADAFRALQQAGVDGEVVISDNGSTDRSQEIAKEAGARVIDVPQKGYGHALRAGIEAARGTYILMGDADGSYDFGELPRFLARLRAGDDLVMGCRFPRHGGHIEPGAMPWKHRWIGNPILSTLGKFFFRSPIHDFHCGIRGFRRDAIRRLHLSTGGMEFASEMVVKATLHKLRMSQVPVTLSPDGRSRRPHLRSWRDGWRHLRFMLLYSPTWLFILPGLFLFLVGAIGFFLLLPAPLTIANTVTFDLGTLLVASAAILVGFQMFSFGLFVKAYAVKAGILPKYSVWAQIADNEHITELGLVVGIASILGGLTYFSLALLNWKSAGFGPLFYQESMRMIIPAVTGIGVGIQIIASGFALAILGVEK
jgi:glycosyltransferase involved in cell wall biosynthesis